MYIHLILSCAESHFATVWGIVCSSWVAINRYTSQRSVLLPEGDCSKPYIERANQMMSRFLVNYIIIFISMHLNLYIYIRELFWYSAKCTACNYPEILHGSWKRCIPFQPRCVLLLALVVCCGGSFLLEQPSSSVMGEYIRMQWFTRIIRVTWLELYLAGGLTWPSIKMHMWIKTAQDQDCDIFL